MKIRKQEGLTLIGFGLALILAVFFAYVAMRLIPLYLEYHAVVGAMDRLQEDPRKISSATTSRSNGKMAFRSMSLTKSAGL
jgi:hypothetical protein